MDNQLQKKATGKPDRLDKYRLHILEGRGLSRQQHLMLTRYTRANTLLCNGFTRQQVVRKLQTEGTCNTTQAYQVVADAIQLFGDVAEASKKGMQHIFYEIFMKTAVKARMKEDFQASNRALENAAKIIKLYEKEDKGFDLAAFMKIGNIEFSTDPEVLKLQQENEQENFEDTDFEEIPDVDEI